MYRSGVGACWPERHPRAVDLVDFRALFFVGDLRIGVALVLAVAGFLTDVETVDFDFAAGVVLDLFDFTGLGLMEDVLVDLLFVREGVILLVVEVSV